MEQRLFNLFNERIVERRVSHGRNPAVESGLKLEIISESWDFDIIGARTGRWSHFPPRIIVQLRRGIRECRNAVRCFAGQMAFRSLLQLQLQPLYPNRAPSFAIAGRLVTSIEDKLETGLGIPRIVAMINRHTIQIIHSSDARDAKAAAKRTCTCSCSCTWYYENLSLMSPRSIV